jgi:hypothetical protein
MIFGRDLFLGDWNWILWPRAWVYIFDFGEKWKISRTPISYQQIAAE